MWMGSRSCHLVQKPPALGIVLVGSEVVASHPRARLEPSTFFPRVENPNLASEMRSSANLYDFTRFPNPVEAKVANLKFSGRTSRGRGRQVMTDWAMSWALLVLARCSQSEAQALRARSQVQAPRIRSVELQAKYLR